ncbi:MAG: tetratricopeptide repeat protein [Steroidobacteraceae bacterium]|nr:tetratricopeptide repeat protein [Steroidobacteraceae bacterium]
MPAARRLIAATLLLAGAAPVQATVPRCGDDAWELAVAAERALARGDWPGSARWYGCAAAGSADPAIAERATRTAFEHRQYAATVRHARRWLALQPASEPARRHLAIGLLRIYDDAGAAVEFGRLLDSAYEDRARGFMVLLGMLAEEGNETGAARVMERLAEADAGIAEAQYAASVLWQRAEDGGRAVAAARRALALRAGWRMAELAEVRAQATRGGQAAALERLAALAADGDPYTRISHAWMLLGADRRDEAAAIFQELRGAGGAAAADAVAGLTAMALDERRFDDAVRLQEDAVRDPQQAETAHWQLGRVAEQRGDPAAAARYYERIRSGARAVPAQLRAWRLWRAEGAPERAELLLDDFLAADPGATRDVVVGVANLLLEEGRAAEAIALVDRALTVLPDDDLRLARGFLLERIDRVPEAVADLRAVLKRRPGDPVAQNALGYTLVDRTRSLQEGRRLIERALAAKPDSYAIQDSMGWALVRLGKLEEGRAWLETAWERSRDPEVAAHLGETYWQLGRIEDARRIWDETLARHPDSRPLLRAIERHPR